MGYENVKLFFANDENKEMVLITDIDETNKNNTYTCVVCGSELNPKAINSKRVTPHFAHLDSSRCNTESLIHWFYKNKFLEKGDKFTVKSNKEQSFVCKQILVEQEYELSDGKKYKPDMTVLTECGETIYFEFDYSNKKKVKDYLDTWLELNNVVVEIDVKTMIQKDEIPKLKALFYEGKCFNVDKGDQYYKTIGKLKERNALLMKSSEEFRDRLEKLDWFWEDF